MSDEPEGRIFIYVIGRWEGPVKVGVAKSPASRLRELRTGCPYKIDLLHMQPARDRQHAMEHERFFHEVYVEKRLAGEWFDIEADLAIEGVVGGFEIEQHFEKEARLAAKVDTSPVEWRG